MTAGSGTSGEATRMIIGLQHAADAAVVGGKAAGLAALLADGERVPPGFVVAVGAAGSLAQEQMAEALAGLGSDRVAVRSSGVAEDGAVRSQAGAHVTRLDVPATVADVVAAVREVAASGDDVAALVQPMVAAAAAGVAFSVDPVTGDDAVLVTAVRGTGEALMSGEVEGQTWRVDDAGVSGAGGDSPVLSRSRLDEIVAAVSRLRAARGHHVDVEFAWDEAGDLVLLQCRPVTGVPVPPEYTVPPGTWEKDVGHSPGPLSPLWCSMDPFGDVSADWAERFGLIVKDVRIERFGGEEYSQVVPLIGAPEDTGRPPPGWLLGLLARVLPPLRARMRTARGVVDGGMLDRLPRRWEETWKPQIVAENERLRRADRAAMSDAELLDHLDTVLAHVRRGLVVHFDLFIPYLVGVHGFVREAGRLLGWDAAQALGALAGWSPASATAGDRLRELGHRIRATDGAAALVGAAAGDPDELVRALADLDAGLADELAEWRAEEGFRLTDYDVAAPSLVELPDVLLGLLGDAVAGRDERPELRARERTRVEKAAAGLAPRGREALLAAYERACGVFGLREDNVRVTGLGPLAAARFAALEMGRRLTERGRLTEAGDVMMLTVDELRSALGDRAVEVADLDAVAASRRAEQAWVRAHPGPLFHGPEPQPPPGLGALPRCGRIINEALIWAMGQELSPPIARQPGEGVLVGGTPCGPGRHTGPVRIIRGADDFGRLRAGDVLVCPIATPAWAALFPLAGAVVCDGGGALSHTAIIAREHGLPTIMGAGDATAQLDEGSVVTVDGATGTVVPA